MTLTLNNDNDNGNPSTSSGQAHNDEQLSIVNK